MKKILFLLLLFPALANAGFLFNAQCYSDTESSLLVWKAQFPFIDNGNAYQLNSSSINSYGAITFQTAHRQLSGGAYYVHPVAVLQLISCDSTLVNTGNIQLMLATLSCVFLFVLGFRVGGSMSNFKGGFA